ncbi:MAG: FtsW/RodA/SpoVE family cell cycle protein, partial [Clostridiales bacterium]|nr:FtsW/RodA/SpoVE family cell cycle protein [Clostridiales bacterium]
MKLLNKIKTFFRETDLILLFTCMLTSAFGVLSVFSAKQWTVTSPGTMPRDCLIMMIAISVGIVMCIIISLIDYEIMIRLWPIIALVALGLMAALFVIGVGPSARSDAKTWIRIGSLFYFQPSELLKVAFIITFSMHLDMLKDKINDIKSILLLTVHAAIPTGLVVVTGDLGSALVFMAIFIGMMFIAGVHLRYFAIAMAAVIIAVPVLWINFFSDFQKQRFLAVYYPNGLTENAYNTVIYQQQQGINAIGSGGFFGKGLFKGTYTQNGLVPESENDMIFTVVGEEFGLLGAFLLLSVLLFIVIKIAYDGKNTKDNVSRLLCDGVALMIAGQVIINIGMCLKALPVIGITLPFMSAGGSSNLCIYLAIGIVMSVYRFNKEREPVNFRLSRLNTP